MKPFCLITRQPRQIVAALVLTSILSLGASLTLLDVASANSLESSQNLVSLKQSRTNLPKTVADAVLRDAQRRLNLPISRLRILKAEQRDWPDGCLGLVEPGVFCTQVMIRGWQVTVNGNQQLLVYRTNDSGSLVKLENSGNQGNGGAVPIPKGELPPPLSVGVVFRAIASGGITGRTSETRLLMDGTVIREITQPKGLGVPAQIHQVSRQQVQQFQRLLERQGFSQFNQLSYPAPNGSADYITITLSSPSSTTRYADIGQNQLPEPLRSVIQAWNQMAR
jgi:hypothetical protein